MKWDLGVSMLCEYDKDGFLGLQHDPYGEQKASAPTVELHHAYGFMSSSLDPETDATAQPTANHCSVLYGWEGSRGHAWLLGDNRVTPKLPPLVKGGSIQYGATGSFWLIDGKTGSQIGYVPYAFINGVATKSLSFEFNVDTAGNESISLIHGEGMALTFTAGGKNSAILKNKSGSVFVEVNDDSAIVNGALVVQGALACGAGATPLALATPLVGILQQLIAVVAAINASTTGAPAAALAGQLATIAAKNANSL
jgi:hypothetical protein